MHKSCVNNNFERNCKIREFGCFVRAPNCSGPLKNLFAQAVMYRHHLLIRWHGVIQDLYVCDTMTVNKENTTSGVQRSAGYYTPFLAPRTVW